MKKIGAIQTEMDINRQAIERISENYTILYIIFDRYSATGSIMPGTNQSSG
jgi:hypothetical protein